MELVKIRLEEADGTLITDEIESLPFDPPPMVVTWEAKTFLLREGLWKVKGELVYFHVFAYALL